MMKLHRIIGLSWSW